jgi:hypothetical protein
MQLSADAWVLQRSWLLPHTHARHLPHICNLHPICLPAAAGYRLFWRRPMAPAATTSYLEH